MLMVVAFFVGVEIGCFEVFFPAELAFVVSELNVCCFGIWLEGLVQLKVFLWDWGLPSVPNGAGRYGCQGRERDLVTVSNRTYDILGEMGRGTEESGLTTSTCNAQSSLESVGYWI